ncbi:hypothetical protein BGZ81_000827 [Podila clonocystis]|nr:hypothetical protein BGZ81_000827 [Podila clonocystis]
MVNFWFTLLFMFTNLAACASAFPNKCLDTAIKQSHTFYLVPQSPPGNVVSKINTSRFLVGGFLGTITFRSGIFCVVSTDMECDSLSPPAADCIYENVQYRIRSRGGDDGYLHVVYPYIEIVPSFQEGSDFYLSEEAGVGLNITYVASNGRKSILTSVGPGYRS